MGRFGYGLTYARPGVIASDEYVYRGGRPAGNIQSFAPVTMRWLAWN
jgi:hypothetical protein